MSNLRKNYRNCLLSPKNSGVISLNFVVCLSVCMFVRGFEAPKRAKTCFFFFFFENLLVNTVFCYTVSSAHCSERNSQKYNLYAHWDKVVISLALFDLVLFDDWSAQLYLPSNIQRSCAIVLEYLTYFDCIFLYKTL